VSSAADLLAAEPAARPTYLGRDLDALTRCHPGVDPDGTVHRHAGDADDGLDALRSAAARAWSGQLPPEEYDETLKALDLT
jgi:glycerol 3-phosphatase-2